MLFFNILVKITAPVFYRQVFHFSPNEIAQTIIVPLVVYASSSFLFNKNIKNIATRLTIAFTFYTAGILLVIGLYMFNHFTPILFATIACLFTAGNAIIIPLSSSEFANAFKDISGLGVGISGTARLFSAGLITFVFSFFGDQITFKVFMIIYVIIFVIELGLFIQVLINYILRKRLSSS